MVLVLLFLSVRNDVEVAFDDNANVSAIKLLLVPRTQDGGKFLEKNLFTRWFSPALNDSEEARKIRTTN